jgi:hypothetical protein
MQRSKGLAMMFLLGTLVVGGALGFSADRLLSGTGLCAPASDRGSWRDQFAQELHLSAAQRVMLDSILDKRHHDRVAIEATVRPQIDSLQRSVRPQMDSVRDRARVDIAKMLDADQQAVFQQMIQRANEHAREEKKKR